MKLEKAEKLLYILIIAMIIVAAVIMAAESVAFIGFLLSCRLSGESVFMLYFSYPVTWIITAAVFFVMFALCFKKIKQTHPASSLVQKQA